MIDTDRFTTNTAARCPSPHVSISEAALEDIGVCICHIRGAAFCLDIIEGVEGHPADTRRLIMASAALLVLIEGQCLEIDKITEAALQVGAEVSL